ncbi:hypothetical protein ANO11243_094130 [Dothideomycetidae sp. 11243]|nr:hypothetical protein ANO11243_094130 [fungal sp. No.11243]
MLSLRSVASLVVVLCVAAGAHGSDMERHRGCRGGIYAAVASALARYPPAESFCSVEYPLPEETVTITGNNGHSTVTKTVTVTTATVVDTVTDTETCTATVYSATCPQPTPTPHLIKRASSPLRPAHNEAVPTAVAVQVQRRDEAHFEPDCAEATKLRHLKQRERSFVRRDHVVHLHDAVKHFFYFVYNDPVHYYDVRIHNVYIYNIPPNNIYDYEV